MTGAVQLYKNCLDVLYWVCAVGCVWWVTESLLNLNSKPFTRSGLSGSGVTSQGQGEATDSVFKTSICLCVGLSWADLPQLGDRVGGVWLTVNSINCWTVDEAKDNFHFITNQNSKVVCVPLVSHDPTEITHTVTGQWDRWGSKLTGGCPTQQTRCALVWKI